jgi:hypothetical protein
MVSLSHVVICTFVQSTDHSLQPDSIIMKHVMHIGLWGLVV